MIIYRQYTLCAAYRCLLEALGSWSPRLKPKSGPGPDLHELDIGLQSQTRRQRCHCWELQDETFAFCGRIGTPRVDLLNRVLSTHLIGFMLRATKKERKSVLKILRYYVSYDAQDSVFCTRVKIECNMWRRSSSLPWCSMHEWRKSEQRDWFTDW